MRVTIPATPLHDAHPGGFFMPKTRRPFDKAPLTIEAQITKLKERGLIIEDDSQAKFYLQHIGYYRLSAYMLPFQKGDHSDEHHQFKKGVTFQNILDVYTFDRKIRLLIMDAIERIEVAIKSAIINEMCVLHGADWYTKAANFISAFDHPQFIGKIKDDIDYGRPLNKINNLSIRHYYETYSSPALPPFWMVCEVMSLGTISVMYGNLPRQDKRRIGAPLNMPAEVLASWIWTTSYLRNLCAHHARIWDRTFTISPIAPYGKEQDFTPNTNFYAMASMLQTFMVQISPETRWSERLKSLLDENGSIPIDRMGFPTDWFNRPLWKK